MDYYDSIPGWGNGPKKVLVVKCVVSAALQALYQACHKDHEVLYGPCASDYTKAAQGYLSVDEQVDFVWRAERKVYQCRYNHYASTSCEACLTDFDRLQRANLTRLHEALKKEVLSMKAGEQQEQQRYVARQASIEALVKRLSSDEYAMMSEHFRAKWAKDL